MSARSMMTAADPGVTKQLTTGHQGVKDGGAHMASRHLLVSPTWLDANLRWVVHGETAALPSACRFEPPLPARIDGHAPHHGPLMDSSRNQTTHRRLRDESGAAGCRQIR